jgi:hypothetical protein
MVYSFAVLSLATAVAAATPATWENCAPELFPSSVLDVQFDPVAPVVGSDSNMIHVLGNLEENITNASCNLSITFSILPGFNEKSTFNGCGNPTVDLPLNFGALYFDAFHCPQPAGEYYWSIRASISENILSGDYGITVDCVGTDNTPLICATAFISLAPVPAPTAAPPSRPTLPPNAPLPPTQIPVTPPTEPLQGSVWGVAIGLVMGIGLFVAGIGFVARRRFRSGQGNAKDAKGNHYYQLLAGDGTGVVSQIPKDCFIPLDRLKIGQNLGDGQFGIVSEGLLGKCPVAIKQVPALPTTACYCQHHYHDHHCNH